LENIHLKEGNDFQNALEVAKQFVGDHLNNFSDAFYKFIVLTTFEQSLDKWKGWILKAH
jgi:hypothetical protein